MTLFTITEHGYGKRTPILDYRLIARGGTGVKNINVTENIYTLGCVKYSNGSGTTTLGVCVWWKKEQ